MTEKTYCTSCFKTLGVSSRMEIYKYLRTHDLVTVSDVVEHIKLTQPTISYHLGEMKRNGIVKSEKRGKEVYYSLNSACPHLNRECVLRNINFHQVQRA